MLSKYYQLKRKIIKQIDILQSKCDKFRFGYSREELFDYDYYFLKNELSKLKAMRVINEKWHHSSENIDNLIVLLERMLAIYGEWDYEEEYNNLIIKLFDAYKLAFNSLWI
jgi:hypothetical protein